MAKKSPERQFLEIFAIIVIPLFFAGAIVWGLHWPQWVMIPLFLIPCGIALLDISINLFMIYASKKPAIYRVE